MGRYFTKNGNKRVLKLIPGNEKKGMVYRALDEYKQHKIATFFCFLMTILGYIWALARLLLPINLKFMGRGTYAFWRAD
jgi:hypothetical protein